MTPAPGVAQIGGAPCARVQAPSSATLETGTEGCTITADGKRANSLRRVKSRRGSKGRLR